MKTKELTKLKGSPTNELEALVVEKRKELDLSIVERAAKKEKNVKLTKLLRRDIAQILTIIREKEIVEETKDEKAKEVKVK